MSVDEIYDTESFDRSEDFFSKCFRKKTKTNGVAVWKKAFAILLLLFAVAYDWFPTDGVVDSMPLVGWLDDVCLTLVALLNVYQQFALNQASDMVRAVALVKWVFIALVIGNVLLLGSLLAAIASLMPA